MPKTSKDQKNSFIKEHKVMLIVASCLAVAILLPVLYMGWLGIMPGVSSVFGSDKPRDLGIRYDTADLQAYNQKISVALMDSAAAPQDPANPAQAQVLANPKYAKDLVLSDKELTASISSLGLNWLPLEDVQVRFTDGTVEASGMLNLEKLDEFNTHVTGRASPGLNGAIAWAKLFKQNVPFYVKANASVSNNTLTYIIDSLEIGRAAVPLGMFNKSITQEQSTTYIKTDNFSIDSARLSEGSLTLSGVYPTVIYLDL